MSNRRMGATTGNGRDGADAGRWAAALRHLGALDERWATRIERIGPCRLRPRRDRFGTLVRAIIGQQISSKAAASIDARLRLAAGGPHEPLRLLALGEPGLRGAGLSGVKTRYVLDLADAVAGGRLPLSQAGRWADERVIEHLTQVKGVGRWTAEMFLIFALNRPDVLPVADLGVRVGIRDHFDLDDLPDPARSRLLTEPWRPFRSIASWYLWRDIELRRQKVPPVS
jgi:DNA-3-methyladenine glycosylase II